ncbi:MAG: alpha/beta fold hydrolase [Myxococcota bacterium]
MLALPLAAPSAARAAPPPTALTLSRVFADPPLGGRTPLQLELRDDGTMIAYLRPNEADSEVLDLWGQRLPGGAAARLVATADLVAASGAQKLTEAERMALERRRVTQSGITEFMWCGESADALLFPFSGDLYWARLGADGAAAEVVRLTRDDEPELAPRCSPKGHFVSYTKGGDLHVLDIAKRSDRRLTRGGSATRTFGLAEFIAQEEMDRFEGQWWSPDEEKLLVFEVDESGVGVKVRPQIFADRTELTSQRYPAAGEPNAKVTAHVYDRKSGRRVTLATPKDDGYLPRAGFFADGAAWVEWQSRDQRRLVLLEADARGGMRPVLEEDDAAWVDLHDDLRPLADGRFLWSSERSGKRQIEVVERKSGARTVLTDEPEPVASLAGVDQKAGVVYYVACASRGRERHVHAVPLAGGAARPIAVEPGWHNVTFAKSGTRFIDSLSTWGRPWRSSLRDGSGASTVLDANPTPELDALTAPVPEWRDFSAEDGTPLNGLLLPPVGAEPGRRYPVVAWVYGGPTAQMVANRWIRQYPLMLLLSQRGYGVLLVDNRGTGGRGRDIDRAHFHRFGDVEVKDLFAAVGALKSVAWVDSDHVGIFGWSYGGYLSARVVLDKASPFAAAVAVAPVTDWSLYDTYYTERYLGLPDGGKAAPYASSSLVARAPLLSRPLLLAHGTADDNVLFEHSLRLIDALEKESLPFDLMIYPGKAHGIAGRAAQLHLYDGVLRFFDRHLRPAR